MTQKTENFKTFVNAVVQEVDNNYSKNPVKYPNQPSGSNMQGGFNKPEDDAWIDMIIQSGDALARDFAKNKTYRHPGILIFEIHVPLEEGESEANEIADDLASIFRGQSIDTTRFRAPSLETVGRVDVDEGAWYRKDLTVPYRRDSQFNI